MAVTLKQAFEYLERIKPFRTISIKCCDGNVTIDMESLSDADKLNNFIKSVVQYTFKDMTAPSYINADIAFISYFLKDFTDFEVPMLDGGNNLIDMQTTYKMAKQLNLLNNILALPDVTELKSYADKQIKYQHDKLIAFAGASSADSEAIESFSYTMNQLSKVAEILHGQLMDGGGKIIENLMNFSREAK